MNIKLRMKYITTNTNISNGVIVKVTYESIESAFEEGEVDSNSSADSASAPPLNDAAAALLSNDSEYVSAFLDRSSSPSFDTDVFEIERRLRPPSRPLLSS